MVNNINPGTMKRMNPSITTNDTAMATPMMGKNRRNPTCSDSTKLTDRPRMS